MFTNLPGELMFDIALHYLTPSDIHNLCNTCKKFNIIIRENESFWHQRFILDFDYDLKEYKKSWKDLYNKHSNFWILGMSSCNVIREPHDETYNEVKQIKNFRSLEASAGCSHFVFVDVDNNVWTFDDGKKYKFRADHKYYNKMGPVCVSNIKGKKVSAGRAHTLIIDLNNNVWVCGKNQHGQLGIGDYQKRRTPEMIANLKAKYVSSGTLHTIIVDLDDNIWTFGCNCYGQLGLGDYNNRCSPTLVPNIKAKYVSAYSCMTLIIDHNNNVWTCGVNHSSQLGLGENILETMPDMKKRYESIESRLGPYSDNVNIFIQIPNIKAKSAYLGADHLAFLDLNNNVWVVGYNGHGQLGLGDRNNRTEISQIPNFKAKDIFAGGWGTFLIDFNNNVWTSGSNYNGQLGLGHTNKVHELTQIPNFKASKVWPSINYTLMIGTQI